MIIDFLTYFFKGVVYSVTFFAALFLIIHWIYG